MATAGPGDGRNAFNGANVLKEYYGKYDARVNLNGILAHAHRHQDNVPNSGYEQLGSRAAGWLRYSTFSGTSQLTGSIPIFFKDLHINGGARPAGCCK